VSVSRVPRRASALLLSLVLALGVLPALSPGGLALADASPSSSVVISQVYGGGGNSGAPYTHDYVELFNRGDAPASLADLSIQYASATGAGNFGANSGQLTELPNVTLAPGQYFLVQQAGGTTGVPLPTPDVVDPTPIAMAAGAGKVALVEGVTTLGCNGGSTPCSGEQLARIIDLVGYGNANFFEGAGAAPTLSNTTAALRAGDGCTDTDDNAADFTAAAPAPRNTATDPSPCGAPVGPILAISQVYGGGGNTGAPAAFYRNDFVEVFNRGDAPASLADLSIQYTSATGTGNFGANAGLLTVLPDVMLAPGQYHLVQLAAGSNTEAEPLPTPDSTGTINMGASAGKVALVEGTTTLGCNGGSTPCSAEQLTRIIDLVGFGNANFFEGSGAAPTLNNNTAAVRAEGGCIDTDDNAADFSTVSPPTPRNTASPLNPCGVAPPPDEPVVPACEDLTVARGQAGSVTLSASDADGTVVDASITSTPIDGITLENASPAPAVGGTFTVDLTAAATLGARDYSVDVTFANDDPTPQTASCTVTVRVMLELPADLCEVDPAEFTPIYEIQGPGAATPIEGERVVTRGVLTADFSSGAGVGTPNNQGLRGFFIEAIAADRDDDPLTSEGVFVFDGGGNAPGEVGDLIHVTGVVGEFNEVTQVSASRHQACDDTGVDTQLPPPAELPLPADPFDRAESFEPLESMRVTHPELTVVEFFQLERFGEVRLSSGGVLKNPTNAVDPYDDEAYEAIVLFNRANNIILDDGRTGQNLNRLPLGEVDPLPYVEPGDTLRIGDQLRDHTTILHFGFGEWRLQPVDIDAITQEFQDNRTRPRPESPPDVGGTMTVASFNVLNYFDGDGQGGGFPTARGAVTASELERQTAKLVDAIERIDADIVGLIEIENDGGEFQATQTLVDALNDAYGDEVYDFVDTGVIGTDAIKMAYIYKPANVQATGDYAILDSSVDPRFDDTRNRPVLAQTFTELRTNEAVTVAVNHLKSKGSNCGGAPDDDPRQGNCNGTRTAAAEAMADWLEGSPTGQDAKGSLIIGDLNAYAKEDPIRTLQEAGYTDLLDRFAPAGVMPYTYTFDATQGYLDHGLADEDVLPFVTGTAAWNINADEVPALDYQESVFLPGGSSRFRTAAVAAAYYQPDAFRSSDHDPVLIGLELRPGGPDCRLLPPKARDRTPECNSGARPSPGSPIGPR
jgi:uncharacterized protein